MSFLWVTVADQFRIMDENNRSAHVSVIDMDKDEPTSEPDTFSEELISVQTELLKMHNNMADFDEHLSRLAVANLRRKEEYKQLSTKQDDRWMFEFGKRMDSALHQGIKTNLTRHIKMIVNQMLDQRLQATIDSNLDHLSFNMASKLSAAARSFQDVIVRIRREGVDPHVLDVCTEIQLLLQSCSTQLFCGAPMDNGSRFSHLRRGSTGLLPEAAFHSREDIGGFPSASSSTDRDHANTEEVIVTDWNTDQTDFTTELADETIF